LNILFFLDERHKAADCASRVFALHWLRLAVVKPEMKAVFSLVFCSPSFFPARA